MYSLGKVKPV